MFLWTSPSLKLGGHGFWLILPIHLKNRHPQMLPLSKSFPICVPSKKSKPEEASNDYSRESKSACLAVSSYVLKNTFLHIPFAFFGVYFSFQQNVSCTPGNFHAPTTGEQRCDWREKPLWFSLYISLLPDSLSSPPTTACSIKWLRSQALTSFVRVI